MMVLPKNLKLGDVVRCYGMDASAFNTAVVTSIGDNIVELSRPHARLVGGNYALLTEQIAVHVDSPHRLEYVDNRNY